MFTHTAPLGKLWINAEIQCVCVCVCEREKGAPVTSFVKNQQQELMVGSALIRALTHHDSCISPSLFVPLVSVTVLSSTLPYTIQCKT